ncbi:MAG: acetyl-CoA carboxylase biotin carboxyl carrier protein [Desulfocucumaceae bacterium]
MKDNGKELTYNLTYKEVVDVLKIINESATCRELRLELGDLKLTVVRELKGTPAVGAEVNYIKHQNGEVASIPAPSVKQDQEVKDNPVNNVESKEIAGAPIKAPMMGTFYRTPAPGEAPFVEVGSKVNADDIIGIIDVMKLMNTIKAGYSGVVKEICVENEQIVDYGQLLMVIDPVAD